jgi:hypothetical protein
MHNGLLEFSHWLFSCFNALARRKMYKNRFIVMMITIISFAFLGMSGFEQRAMAVTLQDVRVPASPIPEADDFSTLAFHDSWDMIEFSDISQYLNGAGRHPSLTNINMQEGIFSATSIGTRFNSIAAIYPLFPGYPGFMDLGDLGVHFPIDSQKYQCMYIAMKVDSPLSQPDGPDGLRVMWYTDKNISPYGAPPNGGTLPVYTNFESSLRPWKLYKVDLRTQPEVGVRWDAYSGWQGLEINPTLYANVNFQIDWVRLTSCNEDQRYLATISWTPDRNITTLWARPLAAGHEILIKSNVDGSKGVFNLDTKGLAPGVYQIGVGTETGVLQWSAGELTIDGKPSVDIIRPSPTSGEDYAEKAGDAWNMDPLDITGVDCASYSAPIDLLKMDTLYPALLSGGCKGPEIGEADPRIFLSMPGALPVASEYRYLSFRIFMNGEIPIPADGMIGRWIWIRRDGCTLVSEDIPLEPGWHTYSVDLYDPFNGMPTAASGCSLTHWLGTGQISRFRFDPNENWTGNLVPAMVFKQELDWVRLTKEDRVEKGKPFPIQLAANDSIVKLNSIEYFYTSNPQNPYQNRALPYIPVGTQPTQGSIESSTNLLDARAIYMPFNMAGYRSDAISYNWDTTSVNPGEYYICVKASNGVSESITCSEAPVQVILP